MKYDSLGDRQKQYEHVNDFCLVKRMPVIIRVDGRAFHTFTKKNNFDKPFDCCLIGNMVSAAKEVAAEMQGFKAAYVQSDEVTFLITDYDNVNSTGWFDYRHSKIVSITAALMTKYFSMKTFPRGIHEYPVFDARAFNVPREDVLNNFLWRAKDWERNSLQMYCRAYFSDKELHGKKRADMHEMLHSIGKNWATDLYPFQKNGTLIFADSLSSDFDISYDGLKTVFEKNNCEF